MRLNLNLLCIFTGLSLIVCTKEAQADQSSHNYTEKQTQPALETYNSTASNPAAIIEQSSLNSKYYCEEFSIKPPSQRNWRASALAELNPSKFPKLFATDVKNGAPADLLKYCPNYPNLLDTQKKTIILRVVDAMVFFESSCNSNARAKGPNGTAYGIFQLHYGREDDYASDCRRYDSKDPFRSIACALDMLHDQVENSKAIFFSGSYWDVLRPRGQSGKATRIANQIWYYPLCQIPKSIKLHNRRPFPLDG